MYQNIFDTHSHYDDNKFDDVREELLKTLPSKGVSKIVTCATTIETCKTSQKYSNEYDYIYYAAGLHPENLEDIDVNAIEQLSQFFTDKKCVAIGEIGLDYYWMSSSKEKQIEYFEKQINLSKEYNLPIIVHDRDAHKDTLDILLKHKPKGVVHCFSGSKEMAQEIIKLGMYIGLNGVATFKNARKSLEVAKSIPLERLVLETDCPYLAPEPFRGKRNDSSYIPYIAKAIAELLNMDTQDLINITNENAHKLYNL